MYFAGSVSAERAYIELGQMQKVLRGKCKKFYYYRCNLLLYFHRWLSPKMRTVSYLIVLIFSSFIFQFLCHAFKLDLLIGLIRRGASQTRIFFRHHHDTNFRKQSECGRHTWSNVQRSNTAQTSTRVSNAVPIGYRVAASHWSTHASRDHRSVSAARDGARRFNDA